MTTIASLIVEYVYWCAWQSGYVASKKLCGQCHTVTATLSLPHCHSHTVTATLSLPHCHCRTVTAALSLPHCHCHTVTATLSLPHCHCHCHTATAISHCQNGLFVFHATNISLVTEREVSGTTFLRKTTQTKKEQRDDTARKAASLLPHYCFRN